MVNFERTNTLIGWLVFVAALLVYGLTLEPSVSFWDCGEFISASYKLQVTHPPGAPLYQMMGRVFSLLAFGNVAMVAFWVNMLSAVASAFTVLFTYFITTRLAVKIVNPVQLPLVKQQAVSIWGAGIIAALSLTVSDTFWFSAVEAEVYALSSFFTALVFWSALKWSDNFNHRWLLFIALAIGLSIGVHLLNLLVIPAVVFVLFFSYYPIRFKSFLWATLTGIGLLVLIQFIIIPGLPFLAAITDLWAVNSVGMAIGSGALLFLIAIIILLSGLLFVFSLLKIKNAVVTILCLCFLLMGYASYMMVPIRAAAEPPLNVGRPSDAFSFLSYLNREQYGSRTLFYGPYYNAPVTEFKIDKPVYRAVNGKYQIIDNTTSYTFHPDYMTAFPRMGDVGSKSSQTGYVGWTGTDPTKPPTFLENIEYFFKYQVLHMYVRYHLWNFAARQNDRQGHGNALDGNGLTGFGWIDQLIAAPENYLPAILANNKGRNNYFLLPFLLGIAGLIFQAKKDKKGFYPLLVLFLFTGIILVFYLNTPPFEPRERDYVFVGSFQVFCTWIGLGALWLSRWLHRHIAKGIWLGLIVSFVFCPVLMATQNWDDHDRSKRSFALDFARNTLAHLAPNAVLFVYGDNATYPLWYLQNVEGYRTDVRVINAYLLGADGAAYELREKKLNSAPLLLSIKPQQYQKGVLGLVRFGEHADSAYSIGKALAFLASDSTKNTIAFQSGRLRGYVPTGNLVFDFDTEKIKNSNYFAPEDSIYYTPQLSLNFSETSIYRSEVLILDIIANNYYNRPIYFSSQSEADNLPLLNKYLRLDGLAYRLVPLLYPGGTPYHNRLNTKQLASALTEMEINGYNNKKLYINPEAITIAQHYRALYTICAEKLITEGNTAMAASIATKCINEMPLDIVDFKHGKHALVLIKALYKGNKTELATRFTQNYSAQLMQKIIYYSSLKNTIATYEGNVEREKDLATLAELKTLLTALGQTNQAIEIEKFMGQYPTNNNK